MSHSSIQQRYAQSPQIGKLQNAIAESEQSGTKNIELKGLVGSSLSFVLSSIFESEDRPFLAIFNDKEEAAYYLNDLERLIGEDHVLFYPGSYRRPYQIEETDNANVLLRAEVLNRI
ncbi:MAG TPA: transcription-repair coupling factor, partial [Maribacter sp.]|nr:transcription-repair coupling factor [Maribacter sp.]